MAKRRPITIDGDVTFVNDQATLKDVVSPSVRSVVTRAGEVIPKERFAQVNVPDGFATNLSEINKGGAIAVE